LNPEEEKKAADEELTSKKYQNEYLTAITETFNEVMKHADLNQSTKQLFLFMAV
jgi:hypothetical protein